MSNSGVCSPPAVSAGPLWSAQSTYLTTLAVGDGDTTSAAATIARFNGVFGGLMQTNQIWGNLVSSLVLSTHNETFHLFTQSAATNDYHTASLSRNRSSRCADR